MTGREAEEIKISLNITSRSHGKGSNSAGGHAVVMLLMGLNIFTVFIVTMAVVIDGLTSDDGAGAQSFGNPVQMREGIKPEHGMVSHLNHHVRGNMHEWKSVIDCSHMLFKGADELLHLPNVLIPGSLVQPNTKVSEVTAHGFKFAIHFSSCNAESGLVVHGGHGLDSINKCGQVVVVKGLYSAKPDVVGHRDQHGYTIDVHHISSEHYMMVPAQDLHR